MVSTHDVAFASSSRTSAEKLPEVLYTLKYPEFKASDGKWVLRQSGLYHRYNTSTSQSLYILLNPMPRSQMQERLLAHLRDHSQATLTNPFWLHGLLLSTHLPAWRQYIAAQEKMFLPKVGCENVVRDGSNQENTGEQYFCGIH